MPLDSHLIELLEDYRPMTDRPLRSVRRPAGDHVLVECFALPEGRDRFLSLAHFWIESLDSFLNDSGSNAEWLEGLAYQSRFQALEPGEFFVEYRALQQNRLTLPPPETTRLSTAYRTLQGRLFGYCGITEDKEMWSAVFGPTHCNV